MNESDVDLLKVQQKVLERTSMYVRVALEALSLRMLTAMALIFNAGMFSAALVWPTWERVLGASVFALASWCLVKVSPKKEQS